MIWKIWKKIKLKCEKIWKMWKKSRLKCKMIRKYGRKVVDMRNNMENLEEREVE
jgi:hypothetical protein